jgi:hypothetical protein
VLQYQKKEEELQKYWEQRNAEPADKRGKNGKKDGEQA